MLANSWAVSPQSPSSRRPAQLLHAELEESKKVGREADGFVGSGPDAV